MGTVKLMHVLFVWKLKERLSSTRATQANAKAYGNALKVRICFSAKRLLAFMMWKTHMHTDI